MFRAATILRNARTEKELSYTEISQKLKVPAKYLEAIETENTVCFPPDPYCSLIVKDYANFLGLDGNHLVSLFRRDFAQKRKIKSQKKAFISFTPQFTFVISVIFLVLVFSSYLLFEYVKYNRPPQLKINWSTSDNSVEISGTTDPESTVRVNQDLIIVDLEGKFQKKLIITPGAKITVESKSPSGKITVEEKNF